MAPQPGMRPEDELSDQHRRSRRRRRPAGPTTLRRAAGRRRPGLPRLAIGSGHRRPGHHGGDRRVPGREGRARAQANTVELPHRRNEWNPDATAAGVRRRRARVRHLLSSVSRWSSRCRSPSASRCSSRTTRRAGSPRLLGYVVDLLAAVPVGRLRPVGRVLPRAAAGRPVGSGSTTTSAGSRCSPATGLVRAARCSPPSVVLAIMILPIIAADQPRGVPPGAPRARRGRARPRRHPWEMIRIAVLPFGRPGVIGAVDARPGPGARRDHRRRPGASARSRSSACTSSSPAATPSPPTSPTRSARPTASASAR